MTFFGWFWFWFWNNVYSNTSKQKEVGQKNQGIWREKKPPQGLRGENDRSLFVSPWITSIDIAPAGLFYILYKINIISLSTLWHCNMRQYTNKYASICVHRMDLHFRYLSVFILSLNFFFGCHAASTSMCELCATVLSVDLPNRCQHLSMHTHNRITVFKTYVFWHKFLWISYFHITVGISSSVLTYFLPFFSFFLFFFIPISLDLFECECFSSFSLFVSLFLPFLLFQFSTQIKCSVWTKAVP